MGKHNIEAKKEWNLCKTCKGKTYCDIRNKFIAACPAFVIEEDRVKIWKNPSIPNAKERFNELKYKGKITL